MTLPKDWVQIRVIDNGVVGQLLRELLEQQGISCVLTQDGTANVFGLSPLLPSAIYVAPESADRARQLIKDYFSEAQA